ncbi:hypothetical protein HRF69_18835 [Bacillus circulans]|uniref:DUF7487 domain-containing protein n=1 Tax=Niallia circulans TaxID=1397 RepID=UPI00156171D2|nr:hypothetical protein [Niallia circulans]NRG29170.1 hypothetical protein [Niallia circulans]
MILTKKISVRWHRKTKEHYEKILMVDGTKKYTFTRWGDRFDADITDVHPNCTATIDLICDYCLRWHPKTYRNWKIHSDKSPVKKDACSKCRGKKIQESNLKTYGVPNVMYLATAKDNLKLTNIIRYGVPNAANNRKVKDKMKQTNINRYGTEYYFQTKEFKEKYTNTMQEKYGVDNSFQAEEVKEKTKQTMLKKFGVEHNMQNPSIRQKAVESMYQRGSTPTSKPQIYLHEIFGGELNYPFERYNLDIAFPEDKIAIEYDGGGHDLKVKLGGISKEAFKRRDIIRKTYLKKAGWNVVTIVSMYDNLPSKRVLLKMLSDAKFMFSTGRSWVEFNIDNNTISYRNCNSEYQFEELSKFKNILKRKTN